MRRSTLGRFLVEIPQTRRERMLGLLGRDGLEPGCAMLFERARSIHTFGMRFPIRVAFLDHRHRVLRTRLLPPRRLAWCGRARHVVELAAGEVVAVGSVLSPGDREPRTTRDARGSGRRART